MSDESNVFFPRKLVKQFILKYKELECLWNRDCTAYKQRSKRHQAITQLTQLVQTYDPAATRVHILRKIDSLRACLRREYKKVTESRQNATCEEDIYVPQLWYYEMFSFLVDQDKQQEITDGKVSVETRVLPPVEENFESAEEVEEDRASSSQSDDVKIEPTTYEMDRYIMECSQPTCSKKSVTPKGPLRKRHRGEGITGLDDEYDAIGMNVAAKLRYLPENIRILAEKLISDVLFQAQTNRLTSASVLVTPDPFH